MSEPFGNRPFPRGALIGAAGLIGLSLLAATAARLTGTGAVIAEPPPPVVAYDLRFEDRDDGGVAVWRGGSDELVVVLEPGTNGFVRGVLRGLARDRRARDIGPAQPFRLSASAGGALVLEDPATGRAIALQAFGPDNVTAFRTLLEAAHGGPLP